MNSRRSFSFAAAVVLAFGPAVAIGQGGRPRRIALLMPTSADQHFWSALKQGLAALGYVEGRDVVYESRGAEGRFERLPALAEELVRARPDVIVTAATPPVLAAKAATARIPIVIATAGDPVKSGAVASLSRPGGNVTGVSNIAGDTSAKLIELARATLPKLARVAILRNPANPGSARGTESARAAATQVGLALLELDARAPADIDAAFAALAAERADALIILSDPFLVSQRERIGSLARVRAVPVFAQVREEAHAGALLTYGADYAQHFRRAAYFVDRILKGAKPGELPIEQAATFALVVNRKAAALGVKIPQEILVRATEVIE